MEESKKAPEVEAQEQKLKELIDNIRWLKIVISILCITSIMQSITLMQNNMTIKTILETVDQTLKLFI